MAECPSGRYASEIVTAGGLTLAQPTGDDSLLDWSGSEWDFAEWDALAVTLIGRLEGAWTRLKGWPATARMPVADYNALADDLNDIRTRYARVRKPWTSEASAWGTLAHAWGVVTPDFAFDATGEVGTLTGIITDAQCLRERIDAACTSMGCSTVEPGDTGHKPPAEGLGIIGKIGLGLGIVGIVGGTYYIAKKVQA